MSCDDDCFCCCDLDCECATGEPDWEILCDTECVCRCNGAYE